MKYRKVITSLDSDELYTPATVARFAVERGLIEDNKQERQRVRISIGRFTNNHYFPDEGDGMVTIPGQSPTPGWFGWRYKDALND